MAIGDKVQDDDLVQIVFDGIPTTWETFLASINGREVQPNFVSLWHDCSTKKVGSKVDAGLHLKRIML